MNPQTELKTNVWLLVTKPPAKVFDAVADPAQLSRYFVSAASGPPVPGKEVVWTWADQRRSLPVRIQAVEKPSRFEFAWAPDGQEATVRIGFAAEGSTATKVTVDAWGWPRNEAGLAQCFAQTQGWMHMLCCLKAHLEYGINLRAGKPAAR